MQASTNPRPRARAAAAALCLGLTACGPRIPIGTPLTPAAALEARTAMATIAGVAGLPPARMYDTYIRITTTEDLSLLDTHRRLDGLTSVQGSHFSILILYSPTQGDIRCATPLYHELYHVALHLKTGDGDARHSNPMWADVAKLAFNPDVCGDSL